MDNTKYNKEELCETVTFTLTVGETLSLYKKLAVAIKGKEREILRMKHKGTAPHLIEFTRAARQRYIALQEKIEVVLAEFDERAA